MNYRINASLSFLLILVFLLFAASFPARANSEEARVINGSCSILLNGKKISSDLLDGHESSYKEYESCRIEITASEDVGSVYIVFDRTPPRWTIENGSETQSCGVYGFLHEYAALTTPSRSLSFVFSEKVSISDVYILSTGSSLPGFVQTWRPAEGPCDVMLLACHSDDDQLFFAGSVPDAVARGAEMQVCYFTNHWNRHSRPHELLNGLWTCGLDRYPVVGDFLDSKKGMSEEEGLKIFAELGITYDDMVKAQTELLRKYKPQIVLVHDINGEYGHSAHRLDSHSLRDAAMISADVTKYPDLAEKYGVWDVPKIYIHLYDKNQISFEIDTPLERFGGKSAYQVSQDAFRCHISQFNSRYRDWLIGTEENPVTKSTEFPMYSPRYYGLWKSTVGPDVKKTDFYEHIVFYADRDVDPPTPTVTTTPTPLPTDPTTVTPSVQPTSEPPTETPTGPSTETTTETPTTALAPTDDPHDETPTASQGEAQTQSAPQTPDDTTGSATKDPQTTPPQSKTHPGVVIGIVSLGTALILTVTVLTVLKIRNGKSKRG